METKAQPYKVFRCHLRQTLGRATSLTPEVMYIRSKDIVTVLAAGLF